MTSKKTGETLFVASPLEAEHVARISAAAGDRIRIVYEPDLLPPTRYTADHGGVPGFRRTGEQMARWDANLAEATILFDFPGGLPVGTHLLSATPRLKWVQTTSSGVGQLVARLGLIGSNIHVTTARGVHAQPLAEFVFAAILDHVKQLAFLREEQRLHHWRRYCGEGIAGKSMLIVGAGQVGEQIGKVAKAFGVEVRAIVNRPSPERADELSAHSVHGIGELKSLLKDADFVVLCIPHTPDTEQLIDASVIAAMKPGAILVNIARGQVIDEPALIAALQSGKLAFAALDVAAVEPLPEDSPLWDMPNVLISPHSASTVASENARIIDIFCKNIPPYLAGRFSEMTNLLNKERMY